MDVSDLEVQDPNDPDEMVLMHQFNVYAHYDGDRELIASRDDLLNIVEWRQARIDLSGLAGIGDLQLELEFNNLSPCAWSLYEGVFIDDIIVGFAERGEIITFAEANPDFAPDPDSVGGTLVGPYQLEVRTAESFGTSQRPTAETRSSLDVFRTFDTNDRLNQSITLIAPAGSDVDNGDTFKISDGNSVLTFEYTTDMDVTSGNVAVPFQVGDGSSDIAESIRDAVNSPAAQGILNLTAGLSEGTNTGSNDYNSSLVNLYGNVVVKAGIDYTIFDLAGDSNRMRDQGQVLIHSNFVTDSRDWGIIADAGMREEEPLVPVGFLQSHAGPVRNLRELNNAPDGGLTPGAVIENNVIAGEGLGGIHVSGSLAPLEIVPPAGPFVCDGQTFTINSYRTSVTFEFEDISGVPRLVVARSKAATVGGKATFLCSIVSRREPGSCVPIRPARTRKPRWLWRSEIRSRAASWSPTGRRCTRKPMSTTVDGFVIRSHCCRSPRPMWTTSVRFSSRTTLTLELCHSANQLSRLRESSTTRSMEMTDCVRSIRAVGWTSPMTPCRMRWKHTRGGSIVRKPM